MTRDPFARETKAMALIGALALALITTEDDMPKPFALYQEATMAAFSNEPRNGREAHRDFVDTVAGSESAARAARRAFGGERTCCDGRCAQGRECPANGWNPLHSNAVHAPQRKPTLLQRLRAWWRRHVVDHRIWD